MTESTDRIFLVDKPFEWTSFDVVSKLRWMLKFHFGKDIKIGHAGTLDPLATGLLILCSGKKTKEIDAYQGQEKEYTGSFFLGGTTPSFDLETPVELKEGFKEPELNEIRKAVEKFKGDILQTPPIHSAKWVDGKRAYKIARAGGSVEMKKNPVHIFEFEVTDYRFPLVSFRIVCSKGTYIRSLANDLGEALGCGAYLHSLVRTRIGAFELSKASSINDLVSKFPARFSRDLKPIS